MSTLRRKPANNVTGDGEHAGLDTVAQSGATRASKPVAKNVEKATTSEEEKVAQESPVSNTRVSHSRRKDQVVDDPQSVAKPEGNWPLLNLLLGGPN